MADSKNGERAAVRCAAHHRPLALRHTVIQAELVDRLQSAVDAGVQERLALAAGAAPRDRKIQRR